MTLSIESLMGTVGVALLLIAFFMNLLGRLSADSVIYLTLNVLGAGLAAFYALILEAPPLVVLEGAWTIAAAYRLIGLLRARMPAC